MKPVRIQRKRTKGFDLQSESMAVNGLPCVYVGRPSKWGNQYRVGEQYMRPRRPLTAQDCMDRYREDIENAAKDTPDWLEPLRGKNLACWCRLDAELCHADILLEIVNR